MHSVDIEENTADQTTASLTFLESLIMTVITRTVSAIAFTATLFASASAFALTPFDAATLANRGQLDGISGYGTLQGQIRSGRVTGEDILEAAGLEVNASDANFVESVLRDRND